MILMIYCLLQAWNAHILNVIWYVCVQKISNGNRFINFLLCCCLLCMQIKGKREDIQESWKFIS